MKTLRYLLVGGVLTLSAAMAKEATKPATPAGHTSQTKAKKRAWWDLHHKHKKTTKTTPPGKGAPVTVAHKK
jgi:hypothetical protein